MISYVKKEPPQINKLTLNLKSIYGEGYLELTPQEGPQRNFISCWGGYSGKPLRDEDFPLIFYGGGQYAPQYMVTCI